MDCQAIDYKNIPVQSDIIAGIIRLDLESNSCFRDLENYVRSDQGIVTLVLRVVNSALYSRGRRIGTIPMAISVLGFNVVRSLALLALSRSLFAQTKNPLFKTHIWQHSLLTALAGQSICQMLGGMADKDEAFIAGLMHDMGKVLLFTHDPARYLQVLELMIGQGLRSLDAERQIFGCDHCAVGREAVTQWKLPERFNDYMGTDLAVPPAAGAASALRLGLLAGNALIASLGIGAQALPDMAARLAVLQAVGLDATHCKLVLNDAFIAGLMEHDTYQLCANL
jgi:HD-like signal output (HDOD) protein